MDGLEYDPFLLGRLVSGSRESCSMLSSHQKHPRWWPKLGENSMIFWTFTLWASNLTEPNDELNDLFRIPTDPIPYQGVQGNDPWIVIAFWKRPWNFSRDLFHQQFQGPIILVMFSLSGISCMTRKRDFYRFPPVHTMITGAEKDCDGGPNSPHLRCTPVLFVGVGSFFGEGKTGVITWHTFGSTLYP